LNTGFNKKAHADNLAGFKVTSQGFLEGSNVGVRCGYYDLKIHASIAAFSIADFTMTNTFFFEQLFFLHFVPYR